MQARTYYTFLVSLFFLFSCADTTLENEVEAPKNEAENPENEGESPKDDGQNNNPVCVITNKDGLLIIEGESFNLKGKWRVVEDEKASGQKYIEYFGANSYQQQNLAHEIDVTFYVDAPATYLVRWYMRQPEDAEGDKSNDIWIYFPDDIGLIKKDNSDFILPAYEKFVSRDIWHTSGFKEGKGEFTYGGAINYGHNKSSWMRARFPAAGEYTLKVCA